MDLPNLDVPLTRAELQRKQREVAFKEQMRRKFEEKKQRLAARRVTRVKRAPVKLREDDEPEESAAPEPRVFTRKPVRVAKLLSKVRRENICNA